MKHVTNSNFPLAGIRTLLFGVFLVAVSIANGQPFSSTYTFGTGGDVTSFAFNGTDPAGGTFGPLVKVGVTSTSSSGNFRASGWPVGVLDVGPVDLGRYFSFTVTVQAGYLLNLSTVNFGIGRSATGPRQWQWRSSLDAYGAPISTYSTLNPSLTQLGGVITNPDATTGYTGNVMDLSGGAYQFLSPGVYEFRVYAYNSEAAGGTGGLQGVFTITGTMIPPTATFVETTGGVAVSPLAASSTDHALIGFSAGSTSGQTLSGITFGTTSNTNGVLTNLRLVRSTDNDFSTPGDNTTIVGASFAQNPTDITVTGLSIPVNLAEPPHYFLVADVTGIVTGSTPTVTLSMADEGIAITGTVADFSFSGDEYSFLGSGSPLLVASAVSPAFGNVCINPALPPTGSFTLEGTDLDPGQDVVIGPLPGFDFFDVDLVDYAPTLTLVHSGSLSVSVDVRFQPTLVQSYDGEIPVTGGDADPTGAAVTGAGINTAATVTTGAVSGITTTEATVGGSYGDIGCSDVTAFGVEYSTDLGFIPGTGTQVAGTDLGGGTWESDLSGLTPCTPYYVRAYATNNAGDAYGAEVSFSTGAPDAPVALAADDVALTSFTANWQTVPGATGYVVDVSTDPTFAIETFGPDLFISEYVEGSGNNKYIEIYNPTGVAVNLSDYQLRLYSNGSATVTGSPSTLSGTLASGATVVYRNGSAALPGTSGYAVASAVNFNGDDALELWKISTAARVDLIGSIGEDPGTEWTGGGLSTLNRTLVRVPTVTGGVTVNPGIGFPTIASEWTGLAIDVTNLGSHSCVAPNIVPTFVPGYEAVSVPGGASDELSITGLDEGETYYYRVRSLIDDCESPNSNTISVITCTTDLNLIFVGDGVTSINWELREQLTNTLIRSGVPTVYPAGTEYSVGTCLHDGDFYLVVTSDLGGIVQGGYQGGYRLETAAGARLIDNSNNFLSGTTSQIANGQGFSLPLGTDRLIYTSCDKVDWRNNEYIVVNPSQSVTDQFGVNNANSGYQIWFYNPNGGYSFQRFQSHSTTNGLPLSATRACHFKINSWSGNQLQPNVLYNVRVRGRANGIYDPWGPACRFVLDPTRAECPLTHLMDVPGNQYLSCGATRPIGSNGASLVHARPVNRYLNGSSMAANKYKFRFRIEAEFVDFTKISNTGQYWVNTLGLAPCKTYLVEVSASFNNGLTYCDTYAAPNPYSPLWGRTCLFSTSGCPVDGNGGNQNMAAFGSAGSAGQLSLYPNPNNGEQLFVSIDMVKEGVEKVSVDIHDSFGKRVSASTIAVNEGFVNTTLDLNGSLAAGMYIVNITAGDVTYTERLVIQP